MLDCAVNTHIVNFMLLFVTEGLCSVIFTVAGSEGLSWDVAGNLTPDDVSHQFTNSSLDHRVQSEMSEMKYNKCCG